MCMCMCMCIYIYIYTYIYIYICAHVYADRHNLFIANDFAMFCEHAVAYLVVAILFSI